MEVSHSFEETAEGAHLWFVSDAKCSLTCTLRRKCRKMGRGGLFILQVPQATNSLTELAVISPFPSSQSHNQEAP